MRASSSLCARSRVATSCSISPRSTAGVRAPLAAASARGGDRRVDLLGARQGDGGDGLLGVGVLDREACARAGDLLAADQQPGLDVSPRSLTTGKYAGWGGCESHT